MMGWENTLVHFLSNENFVSLVFLMQINNRIITRTFNETKMGTRLRGLGTNGYILFTISPVNMRSAKLNPTDKTNLSIGLISKPLTNI